ncbi:hypothetical protein Htur_0811 [Haloterrigena turkmenica DSM 5511]|uniref:Uncharacterized protein n=1 Tax=Haloterrigena turkmenica (strain ATCC 51198 / DSM 5511 / JCM 9101 / NCIMB 13204 / VKM B-1734 / 4k) TaxID=543526 RepID=D2RXM3_HALTV|nr:hypothetical protein Htur_0811 [Haloterrigena turkmenica DSM 5511]
MTSGGPKQRRGRRVTAGVSASGGPKRRGPDRLGGAEADMKGGGWHDGETTASGDLLVGDQRG